MDTSLKLQLDVRNNATDLQNYMLDLNNWEEEMKRKESELSNESHPERILPPPRNKIKRSKPENEKNSNKPKKISAYDYSAWDKFDVEKACAEIDNDEVEDEEDDNTNEEISITEGNESNSLNEKNLSLIDEAFYEKEMGNQFVKKEQWTDAIKCYTNAINLDGNNAIYYANRSLCFLKTQNFKAAETDATAAIQLDKKYVKAYQRRAFARQALGQLAEAKSDYEEILKLEPKNALSRVEISKIENKLNKDNKATESKVKEKTFDPKNFFKSDDSKADVKKSTSTSKDVPKTKKMVSSKSETVINKPKTISSDSKCKSESTTSINIKMKSSVSTNEIRAVEKGGDGEKIIPNHITKLGSSDVFKPLPEWCKIIHPVDLPPHKRSNRPLRKIPIKLVYEDEDYNSRTCEKKECSSTGEKKDEEVIVHKPNEEEDLRIEQFSLDVPKTAIQFQKCWKILTKNSKEAYSYLEKIPGSKLPEIFDNSLESDFFSELITFLASDDVEKKADFVYEFLLGLTAVKRFSSLTLFMSEVDRKCLKKCLTELGKTKSETEISELFRLYELKI